MIAVFKLYKNIISSIAIIVILTIWAISSTVIAMTKSDKVLLIESSPSGVRIISADDNENRVSHEYRAFLRLYTLLVYNYDHTTFLGNIEEVRNILSRGYLDSFMEEVSKAFPIIESRKIAQVSTIEKIVKNKSDEFELTLNTNVFKNGGNEEFKILVKMKLNETQRSFENPWGIEVEYAKEDRI